MRGGRRGHELPLKSGAEQDAFTRWRHVLGWRPGTIKWIKRCYHKRERRAIREQLERDDDGT